MKQIKIRPVANNCTREEQIEKIKEEFVEFVYEANMEKSKDNEKEEIMDLMQACITYYEDHLGDLKLDWKYLHNPKMADRNWKARD